MASTLERIEAWDTEAVLVGAMNFPGRSVLKEIHRIAEDGFDLIDLTLEPPAVWFPDGKEVGSLIRDLGLQVVGHTPWHLPIASPFPEIRTAAHDLYKRALDCFADAEVELVNIHPDVRIPMHPKDHMRSANAEAIGELAALAAARGITLMVENLDRHFSGVEDLKAIFEAVPEVDLHLDVGHANLNLGLEGKNRTPALLDAFGDRLAHVHISDNRGTGDDLHLPIGAGTVDWRMVIKALKKIGYDGTVTLEVFSREREYLRLSRKLWIKWWSDS